MSSNDTISLEEIRIESRERDGKRPSAGARKNRGRRSRKRRNSSASDGSDQIPLLGQNPGETTESGNGERDGQPAVDSRERGPPSTQEDHRTKFYEKYRHEAEEYDLEFVKAHDGELNTTLIFGGLFSVMISAFIIHIQPQLQPDPNGETATLLRVLIHKIDNTTFGNDVSTVPQWTGPPRAIIQVQAILYTSLAISLLSASLAIFLKQWLNRYTSTGMRGSVIERSQNRQQKLDGITAWYLDHAMVSLPLMLQSALLLFACALSRYLWGINKAVASVILGVTSFGVAFYIFIVIMGAVSASCPYQTPGAHILCHISSASSPFIHNSKFIGLCAIWWGDLMGLKWSSFLMDTLLLPVYLALDIYLLMKAMARAFVAIPHNVHGWFHSLYKRNPQVVVLDVQCITWVLQESLDKSTHLFALKLLATITTLGSFNPKLVSTCFDILMGCAVVIGNKVVVVQDSEELIAASALCCLHTFSHLATMDPASSVLDDVCQLYTRTLPSAANFEGLPSYHCFVIIHRIFYPSHKLPQWQTLQWKDFELPSNEHVVLAQLAQFEYQRRQHEVPRWILCFALHHLSHTPLPPAPIVTSCLSIIAIDLGCTVPKTATPDESAQQDKVSFLITQKLRDMSHAGNANQIRSKRKAITTFFPYAVWQEKCGNHKMLDAFFSTARAFNPMGKLIDWDKFMWKAIRCFISTLYDGTNPDSLNWVITLVSPYVLLETWSLNEHMVTQWAAASLAVPYSEEVGQSVVAVLLRLASIDSLQPYIPIAIWAFLKKKLSLPHKPLGRTLETSGPVVRSIQSLEDIEILKSYFLLVWSDWYPPWGFAAMCTSISEDFSGMEMKHHRRELIQQLDHVLAQLDQGLEYLQQYSPDISGPDIQVTKERYGEFRKLLLGY